MSLIQTTAVISEIRCITKKPFDFWLLNLEHDYRNLQRFFDSADVPRGAELFTSECVFPGREIELILAESPSELSEVELLREERRLYMELAKGLQGFGSSLFSSPEMEKAINCARSSGAKLWLGMHYLDKGDRLYNSYVLIEDGEIQFVHRKRFLWPTEEGISEVIGREGENAIATPHYDGIFKNRAFLICQEAPRFYSPKWGRSPTHIPEIRAAKPDFVFIPAHWIGEEGDPPKVRAEKERMLRQIALSISRRIKEPIDKYSAVRKRGCLTFVINAYEAYVCGPATGKRIKACVYARQPKRGWLRVTNAGITTGEF